MKHNPYDVVRDFEDELCWYTGAPHAVAVTSCTIALEMLCAHLKVGKVAIPRRTYASVPQAIVKAGGYVEFCDSKWHGAYVLGGTSIWDCAPRFTSGMYFPGSHQCLSFHRRKILGHTEGGAILTDDANVATALRVMRHDGRPAGQVMPTMIGYHAVMSPGTAAELLASMGHIAQYNPDMPTDDYPDLSTVDWNGMWSSRWGSKQPQPTTKMSQQQWQETQELVLGLQEVRRLRAENNDNWMDLLVHVAKTDPLYFREWQGKTRAKDMKVSEAMKSCV